MAVSKEEQETIIIIPRDGSQPVRISTSDSMMMTKMRNLCKAKDTTWKKTESQTVHGEIAEEFYESYDHKAVLLRAKARQGVSHPQTEEQKKAFAERMCQSRARS